MAGPRTTSAFIRRLRASDQTKADAGRWDRVFVCCLARLCGMLLARSLVKGRSVHAVARRTRIRSCRTTKEPVAKIPAGGDGLGRHAGQLHEELQEPHCTSLR